jgi:hypothetical protein
MLPSASIAVLGISVLKVPSHIENYLEVDLLHNNNNHIIPTSPPFQLATDQKSAFKSKKKTQNTVDLQNTRTPGNEAEVALMG